MTQYLVTNNSEDKVKIVRPADKATIRMRGREVIRTDWYPEEAKTDGRFYIREIPEEVVDITEIKAIAKEVKERVEKLKTERIAERDRKVIEEKEKRKKKLKNKKEVD